MAKRIARIILIAGGVIVLGVATAMIWLKAHEGDIVFAAERSRQHILRALPADAERVALPVANTA